MGEPSVNARRCAAWQGAFAVFDGATMKPKYTSFAHVPHPKVPPMAYAGGRALYCADCVTPVRAFLLTPACAAGGMGGMMGM